MAREETGFRCGGSRCLRERFIKSAFDEPGNIVVLLKVHSELEGNGVDISEHLVRKEMDRLLEQAREELR